MFARDAGKDEKADFPFSQKRLKTSLVGSFLGQTARSIFLSR